MCNFKRFFPYALVGTELGIGEITGIREQLRDSREFIFDRTITVQLLGGEVGKRNFSFIGGPDWVPNKKPPKLEFHVGDTILVSFQRNRNNANNVKVGVVSPSPVSFPS